MLKSMTIAVITPNKDAGGIPKAITRRGEITIGARVVDTIKKGVIFIPFHFVECAANILTNNALDPTAKIPEFKACACKIEKIKEA
ncbi:MAG: Formate dehydrogenase subunit alpha [Methanoregulaceae archaeon PtaU1.Bin222]|nr:MAG: Formate dehydrogenase subunit alpha [Methanoregulaceae archaeon PtaU1.Bin222]